MRHLIVVTVLGGVAEVDQLTVPEGIDVEILDYDDLAADEAGTKAYWSKELMDYYERRQS